MDRIVIGTASGVEQLSTRMRIALADCGPRHLELATRSCGGYDFLEIVWEPSADGEGPFRARMIDRVIQELGSFILCVWAPDLARQLIVTNYRYFDAPDQEEIYLRVLREFRRSGEDEGSSPALCRPGQEDQVHSRLREFFEESDQLILEGFVTFRLREIGSELEQVVDRVADDFLVEREYREFIRLLQYFVDSQTPRIDEVHILFGPDDTFELVDRHNNIISNECLREFVDGLTQVPVSGEDLLISALITIAPERVVVHCPQGVTRSEVDLVCGVFGHRVLICAGCHRCGAAARPAGGDSGFNDDPYAAWRRHGRRI